MVVADINSAVDYGHAALRGHLTGGYDFVMAQGSSYATLNQSSASFLDQYAMVSGTSFSAPIVAGEAALILSKQVNGLRDAIAAGSVNIDAQNQHYVGRLGKGRVDITSGVGGK